MIDIAECDFDPLVTWAETVGHDWSAPVELEVFLPIYVTFSP